MISKMPSLIQLKTAYPQIYCFSENKIEDPNYFYQIRNGKRVRVRKTRKNLKPLAVPLNIEGINVYTNTDAKTGKKIDPNQLSSAKRKKIKQQLEEHFDNEAIKAKIRSKRKRFLLFSSPDYYYQNRNGKRVRVRKNKNIYGGWWSNRTTATVVKAKSNSEARSKIKAKYKKGYGKVAKVALLSDRDAQKARKGEWVRTRINGKSPTESRQKSKYRSWLN